METLLQWSCFVLHYSITVLSWVALSMHSDSNSKNPECFNLLRFSEHLDRDSVES